MATNFTSFKGHNETCQMFSIGQKQLFFWDVQFSGMLHGFWLMDYVEDKISLSILVTQQG